MKENFDPGWLINDRHQSKALTKYEIRRVESKIQRAFTLKEPFYPEALAATCALAGELYEKLLTLTSADNINSPAFPPAIYYEHWYDCYQYILTLQTALKTTSELIDEKRYLAALCHQYRQLTILLAEQQKVTAIATIPLFLQQLIAARTKKEWFIALTQGALNSHLSSAYLLSSMIDKLDTARLLQLAKPFFQQPFIHLTHAVFICKLQPQKLSPTLLHPEKLVSIQHRINMLYTFILLLHQTVQKLLLERKLPTLPDYLFHDLEKLPQGVDVHLSTQDKQLIYHAITSSSPPPKTHATLIDHNPLETLLCAYKYRFNPNRLVDVIWRLTYQTNNTAFIQQLSSYFKQLTSTQCLDLYGYFSNKDTNYFLRTLASILSETEFSWLPPLHEEEKKALAHTFEITCAIMDGLREELGKRGIHTTSYPAIQTKETIQAIKPSQRNRHAMLRIIHLYGRKPLPTNTKLEQLFLALEH